MSTQEDWSTRYITLPCNKCKRYWQDVKYCTKYEILVFTKEFNDIQTNKCLEKIEENINMWKYNRGEIV